MNDFTYEELIELLDCIQYKSVLRFGKMYTSYPILEIKVKALIKNYCEHTWVESAGRPYCVKCGVFG